MIKGHTLTKNQTALDFVRNDKYEYTLTGSQFFGGAKADSDYDFFIQDSEEIREHLMDNGFHNIYPDMQDYVDDLNIAEVFGRENVHIQLVKDIKAKSFVQSQLYVYRGIFKYMLLDKTERKHLWNMLFQTYQGGKRNQ